MSELLLVVVLILAGVAGAPVRAAELGDPTRPPDARLRPVAVTDRAALRLTAIYLSEHARAAVVDGRRVRAGDSIGAQRVESIRRDRVILSGPEGTLELRLAPQVRRTTERTGGTR